MPEAGLLKVGNLFYGTAAIRGAYGYGTVYKMTSSGTVTDIYSFQGGNDGAGPIAPLIKDGNALYGVTPGGGPANTGTIFKITTAGIETVLSLWNRNDLAQ